MDFYISRAVLAGKMGSIMNLALRFGLIMGALLLLAFVAIIRVSHTAPRLGLNKGRLLPCPQSPNCVNSERSPGLALRLEDYPQEQAWQLLKNIITAQRGKLIEQNQTYLRAEFYSKWMKFVDDLEAHLDKKKAVIHLRSASRLGHYDFGVNRERVETIKRKMDVYLHPEALQPRPE